jgi:hypothetical protein
MIKNIGIIALIFVVVVVGYMIFKSMYSPKPSASAQSQGQGTKLTDLPDYKFAYKVYPGDLTSDAKTALTGWNINPTINSDGSTTVTLTPNNASDQVKTYTVKSGDSLYFVEKSRGDDSQDTNTDANLQDDYGIIVNANGIVQ